jgi:hypothetical protein
MSSAIAAVDAAQHRPCHRAAGLVPRLVLLAGILAVAAAHWVKPRGTVQGQHGLCYSPRARPVRERMPPPARLMR